MSDMIHHPHDAVFKKTMQDVRIAKDLLQQYLPHKTQKIIDWNTLQLTNSSYIDDDLKQSASDVVYQVDTKHGDGYIALLLEHQRTPAKNMPLRLIEYSIRVMKNHLDQDNDYLPIVLPIVIYNGSQSPYPYSTDFFDGFESPETAKKLLFKPFRLIDLPSIDDQVIMKNKWASLLQLGLKYAHLRDQKKLLDSLKAWSVSDYRKLILSHEGEPYAKIMIYYLCKTVDVDYQDLQTAFQTQQPDQLEEIVMTVAEQLRQEGMQRGMQRGRQEGIRTGRQETMRELARTMLADGESLAKIVKYTKLSPQAIKKLQKKN